MKQDYENELQQPMDGYEIPPEASLSAEMVQKSPFDTLERGLKNIFGENFDINDKVAQEALLKHLAINRKQNEKLAETLEHDPRLAQMLVDMIDGRRNAHSALARYFGRSMARMSEDSPEYEEMMQADEERREEILRAAADRREYESNLNSSRGVIERFCKERGYNVPDFMSSVWERLVMPILSGNYSYEVCTALEHALNYEQDVEDAFAAGDIKGRNTNIQRMREDLGDGMPKGMSSVAPETAAPRRRNSLIEAALNA